ncbi:MAG: glutathionylspermidine synthase family protein [Marinospirillum sp.]|uniref:glutathionylspermidine synthase family protein n=1 Tax=Marinospirillum sp. TaxID=2183934 RepID=UPI0019DF3895|nr:glutathionylspermidine synthase family protein [Marinospirillum sp.]MBE0506770.1 glutathionylspermidine synthase family protein [Marinospirillum sp.]
MAIQYLQPYQAPAERIDDRTLYFASTKHSEEDRGTVQYMQDIAAQAGLSAPYVAIEDIGLGDIELKREERPKGDLWQHFLCANELPIRNIFKLCPWEDMFEDKFSPFLAESKTEWFEPEWKIILSNKAILPLLWQFHEGHPNLLPSFFDETPDQPLKSGWVRKPFFSPEGKNIELMDHAGQLHEVQGGYAAKRPGYIQQAFHPLPKFGDAYTLIGSWVVGDRACGIGIREDNSVITKDSSRFLPHIISG